MFDLTDDDHRLKILGCGDGPAAFNAEATRRGVQVVSCDPIYRLETAQIRQRIAATYDDILDQVRSNAEAFLWDSIRSVEDLGRLRMAAMQEFLEDYGSGTTKGRYVAAELPTLPFANTAFDLALCSHFLFLYTTQLGEAFHRLAIREMCRVAAEVRIFPLLALGGGPSPLVSIMVRDLRDWGYEVSLEDVPYEFQRGAHTMLRVRPYRRPGVYS